MCKISLIIGIKSRFKVTLLTFFIPDFNLLSFQLDIFTFEVLFESFYINIILKQNKLNLQYSHSSLWKFLNGFFCFFNNEKHCYIIWSI